MTGIKSFQRRVNENFGNIARRLLSSEETGLLKHQQKGRMMNNQPAIREEELKNRGDTGSPLVGLEWWGWAMYDIMPRNFQHSVSMARPARTVGCDVVL